MIEFLRTVRWALWLGWQVESNWTRPWLFALYVLVKPMTGTLLFVCMFQAALSANPETSTGLLAFTFVGNALYMFAGAIGFSMSAALVTDREQYGMLKYWRICPIGLQSYLVGRGLASGARGMLGALITLAAGFALPLGLGEHINPYTIAWGWLLGYLILGVVLSLALGLILVAAVLNMARHGMFLSEGVGSALYLLSGTLFPLAVLPSWLQFLSCCLPHTYWMEGLRKTLFSSEVASGPLASWPQPSLFLVVLASTVVLFCAGEFVFRAAERRALRRGRYDVTTGH